MNVSHAIAVFRGHREPRLRLIQHRHWWFALSGTVILLSLVGLFVRHLNLSIDFEGGSQITYEDRADVSVGDVSDLLSGAPYNLSDSEVLAGLAEADIEILSPPAGVTDGRRVSVGGL